MTANKLSVEELFLRRCNCKTWVRFPHKLPSKVSLLLLAVAGVEMAWLHAQ